MLGKLEKKGKQKNKRKQKREHEKSRNCHALKRHKKATTGNKK